MESGLRLTERYRLIERLDGGATLEVWRAWDELLGRPVAVKLLTPARPDLHGAFQKGVNGAAGLSHGGLETVYDSDRTRDASGRLTSYVVTEFLSGETLAERLRRGAPPAAEAADICGQIASALEAAHAAGVAHGDLRPGKVVLTCGDAKIVDVGIGAVLRSARVDTTQLDTVRLSSDDLTIAENGPEDGAESAGAAIAADMRAFGAVITACLAGRTEPEAPGALGPLTALAALAARCGAADDALLPSAAEAAEALAREDEPSAAAVFRTAISGTRPTGTRTARFSRAHPSGHGHGGTTARGATARGGMRRAANATTHGERRHSGKGKPARKRGSGPGVRLAAVAVTIAIPLTAAATILASAPRTPSVIPPAVRARTDPATTAPADPANTADPADAAGPRSPSASPRRSVETDVTAALGRLRPIVSSGYASGEIRSDVAIDLDNVIANLERDIASDRIVNVTARIASLQQKIVTRLRERALSRELADRLTGVLATIPV
ncbi:protein kinase domain-containing protein [Actinomadura fibrosa]|uniref:non-specific serine/threonine protein kinase n=1 Tax=Actinomadura fibrosa TaxID=111802 RepID=A0ABW2XKD6_9ACTN|nr:hypothetical protein [Actinomadura fibrosa]